MDIFSKVWNLITGFFENLLNVALMILPDSPFIFLDNSPVRPYLGYFNWIFPVNEIIVTLETWLIAIGIFYTVQAMLRWAKAIE